MKKILGLDLGVNSIGYALIEQDAEPSKTKIIKTGVRIVNEDPDFHGKFYQGNSASKNAARREKRSARRSNQRFKQRRNKVNKVLQKYNMFPPNDLLINISENMLYKLRDKAVKEKITLEELGRVLIHINHKRGYKSNRKARTEEENSSSYLKDIAELGLLTTNRTIGSFWYQFLQYKNKSFDRIDYDLLEWFEKKTNEDPNFRIKENVFPRQLYINEFESIWKVQSRFYPDILTGTPERDEKQNKETLYQLIKNEIIYYQRPLKSQKHLINTCSFEKHHKVSPKSSPLYQVYRIWQQINNIEIRSSEGEIFYPTEEDRKTLFNTLHDPKNLTKRGTLAYSKILKLLKFPTQGFYLNFNQLEGNKTYLILYNALEKANIEQSEDYLFFNPYKIDEKGGLWHLWHITYSIDNEEDIINTLKKHFPFSTEQSYIIAHNVGYTSDFGSLSARAIRKLLPNLEKGLNYYESCKEIGYENPEHINRDLNDLLFPLAPNTLRNPVVEQILNQLTNVLNNIIKIYGKPDEVRIEMSRELKNNADQRKRITENNRSLRKYNDTIVLELKEKYRFKRVSGIDLTRYRLWEETNKCCLYCGKNITFSQLYNGETEIEHILPKSRTFNDALSNKIIAHRKCNQDKDQDTAYDFMMHKGKLQLDRYVEDVNKLYQEGSSRLITTKLIPISKAKWQNLLCKGEDIPNDFVERQKKDSQYIAKETIKRLKSIFPKVTTTTGSVTDFLRDKWKLKHVMQELNLDKYKRVNRVEKKIINDNQGNEKEIDDIIDWTKRDDHRHHAVDALIIAFTSQSIIQKLNNLNQEYKTYMELKESALTFPEPIPYFRDNAKKTLESILVSFKKPNSKVLTKNINEIKTKYGIIKQETWTPRGSLHEDTVLGSIKWYETVSLNKKFNIEWLPLIVNSDVKGAIHNHLQQNDMDVKKAFKAPFIFNNNPIDTITIFKKRYTKRVPLNENISPAQISKIIDKKIQEIIEQRISEAGSIKKVFSEYEKHPLYLNREKKIRINHVTVFDEGKLLPVHKGYVYTKGNHHSLIYEDEKGNYIDHVVSFWEAVETGLQNLREKGTIYPIIDRTNKPGLTFKFSIQINDLFVLDLRLEDIDLFNPDNRPMISKHLYRVQSISAKDYFFRHHLETTLNNKESFALQRMQSLNKLKNVTKIKLDNLGNIIKTGE